MVKNLWKQIEVICGNHPTVNEKVVMQPKVGHRSMFYSCPKYYSEARTVGERACKNNVSTEDFEKILEYLSKEIENMMMSGQKPCLKNLKFKIKNIQIEVTEHTDDLLQIKVFNKKSIDS